MREELLETADPSLTHLAVTTRTQPAPKCTCGYHRTPPACTQPAPSLNPACTRPAPRPLASASQVREELLSIFASLVPTKQLAIECVDPSCLSAGLTFKVGTSLGLGLGFRFGLGLGLG